VAKISFIDMQPNHLTHAVAREWNAPKIITNAVRLSRGPWRLAAAVDRKRLAFSQQLFGLWPLPESRQMSLESYAAVLNGPIANAFFSTRYPSHRFRVGSFKELPIPPSLPLNLGDMVAEYTKLVASADIFRLSDRRASELLTCIDAMVLEAYDLPVRLERQLLDLFCGATRPVSHSWAHWDENNTSPGLHLSERLSGRFRPNGNWVAEVFSVLPENEADLLRNYGE
jgi:hypothetical protein